MKVNTLTGLLDKMWSDYVEINPLAQKVYDLLTNDGEHILNDHIALRTFNHPRLRLLIIAISKPPPKAKPFTQAIVG